MILTSQKVPHTGTDSGPPSHCLVALLDGPSVTFWSCPQTAVIPVTTKHEIPDSVAELELCLMPDRLVVVGRSTGRSPVPYLDPAYRPTPILPDTGQSVLLGHGEMDNCVSRAHFTLRGTAGGGIVFTNGVPRSGGGVRPPMNGTMMVAPTVRWLGPGEELALEPGEAVSVRLPNRCVLQLRAG
jgi:hypothetical protein